MTLIDRCLPSMVRASSGNKSNTFKPKKCHDRGTKRYELHKQAKATLGSGNLKAAVQLPESEDINEWLAVNSTPRPPGSYASLGDKH